jgi:hypothetical protein
MHMLDPHRPFLGRRMTDFSAKDKAFWSRRTSPPQHAERLAVRSKGCLSNKPALAMTFGRASYLTDVAQLLVSWGCGWGRSLCKIIGPSFVPSLQA